MQDLLPVQIALAIVGWILVVLLSLLLLAVLIPTRFRVVGTLRSDRIDGAADIDWAFGLLGVHAAPSDGLVFRVVGRRAFRLRRSSDRERKEKRPKPKRERGRRRSPFTKRSALRLVRRLIRSLQLRARLSGRIGTGDPADTAKLFAVVALADRTLAGVDVGDLRIDWVEPAADLDARLAGRVWPIVIAWVAGSELLRSRRLE